MKIILLFTLLTHALSVQALSVQNSVAIIFFCSQVREYQESYSQDDVEYSQVYPESEAQRSNEPPSIFQKYCTCLQKRRDQLMRHFYGENQK